MKVCTAALVFLPLGLTIARCNCFLHIPQPMGDSTPRRFAPNQARASQEKRECWPLEDTATGTHIKVFGQLVTSEVRSMIQRSWFGCWLITPPKKGRRVKLQVPSHPFIKLCRMIYILLGKGQSQG